MSMPASKTETNILLIEDRPSDAELVRIYLEGAGKDSFHVLHARDMATAMHMLVEGKLHAVMLDLFLPDTSDFDGLTRIQSMAPTMPVVILTGRDDEDMAFKAVELGAQDYLLKEKIDSKTLQRSIRYAIQRKNFEEAIIYQANFDRMTGLANRDLFNERLRVALERHHRLRQGVGLLLLDLDKFKAVNDGMGHEAGDIVLKEVARRISQCLRPYDLAARIGGDEFAVLIEDVAQMCDCDAVAKKLIASIDAPIQVYDQLVHVGVSIGIRLCTGDDDIPAQILLRQADEAMYRAKQDAHSSYVFYQLPGCPSQASKPSFAR